MQQINEKQHYATIISSLNKEYNNLKLGRRMNTVDSYLLDIVFNLIHNEKLNLTTTDEQSLLKIYNTILYNSKTICSDVYIDTCESEIKSKFIQADNTDCGSTSSGSSPEIPVYHISYWQENSISNTIEDIIPEVDNRVKQDATYPAFETGVTINYSNIGRVCFMLNNTLSSDEYSIYDLLDNNVTSSFSRYYDSTDKYILFVSNNIYSYGDILFKIKI